MEFNKQSRRQVQIEKQIQESLAGYILKNFNLAKDGLVSVTRVQVPHDLKTAKVFVHRLTSASQAEAIDGASNEETLIEKLETQVGSMQRYVAQELKLKFCPKLHFYYDRGFDKSLSVEKNIYELSEANKKSDEDAE